MAIPLALLAQGVPSAVSFLSSIFGGDSPQEKAQKELERIMRQGLDPALLNRALRTLGARENQERSGILARLRAGNINPSSGLAQEAVGASKRSLAGREGEARALFNEQSEAAKERARMALLGLPQDDSPGQLLGNLLGAVNSYTQNQQQQRQGGQFTTGGTATANPNIGLQSNRLQMLQQPYEPMPMNNAMPRLNLMNQPMRRRSMSQLSPYYNTGVY